MAESVRSGRTIWVIVPSFFPIVGGAEMQARRQAGWLLDRGWSVRVLTRRSNRGSRLPAGDTVDGIPVVRVYAPGASKLGAALFVLSGTWYLLRRGRRGIYHAHDLGAAGGLAVAARYLLGGRCVAKLRTGRRYYEGRFASSLARWQFKTLLRLVDRIVVVNNEVKNWLVDLGIPSRRVVLVPNAVNTARYRPASGEERVASRRQLGLPVDKTLVSYVGRLAHLKGVDVLLRAWALLPARMRNDACLVIVGDGEKRDSLGQMVDSLGLCGSVLMVGEQMEVLSYYWSSDVFVLPSRTEGLSNALAEAMACGLPSVVSAVGGALDLVSEGVNGFFFEPENHEQLAQKLAGLVTARSRWSALGEKARQAVLSFANLDVTGDFLREMYESLF